MKQDVETKRSSPRGRKQSFPPGIGLAIAIMVISGVAFWFWLSGRANPHQPQAPNISDLTEVDEGDVSGALTSMTLSNAALAQFQGGKDGNCRRPLAWVTLAPVPGEPPSHIRLISGGYFSPVFEISATPVRVAIPFPAPYETGHGILTAINVGGTATISLLPTWRISAQDGRATRTVTWNPVKRCGPRDE